jgi:transposase
MGDRYRSREKISASQQQEPARPQDGELRKQQDRSEEIDDRECRLIARKRRRNLGHRYAGERRGADENNRRDADHDHRHHALARFCRQRGQKDVAVMWVHDSLRRFGVERAG